MDAFTRHLSQSNLQMHGGPLVDRWVLTDPRELRQANKQIEKMGKLTRLEGLVIEKETLEAMALKDTIAIKFSDDDEYQKLVDQIHYFQRCTKTGFKVRYHCRDSVFYIVRMD